MKSTMSTNKQLPAKQIRSAESLNAFLALALKYWKTQGRIFMWGRLSLNQCMVGQTRRQEPGGLWSHCRVRCVSLFGEKLKVLSVQDVLRWSNLKKKNSTLVEMFSPNVCTCTKVVSAGIVGVPSFCAPNPRVAAAQAGSTAACCAELPASLVTAAPSDEASAIYEARLSAQARPR